MSDLKRFMQRIRLRIPSPRATTVACCVIVGVFMHPRFWVYSGLESYLGVLVALLAIALTDVIIPGYVSTGEGDWLRLPSIVFLSTVLFLLPALAIAGLCRRLVPNIVISLLVFVWMVAYLSIYVIFRLPEPLSL